MLKSGAKILADALLTLFNLVLESGVFPKAWKTSILHILHKSGIKTDPNNFRGICISSCLGKLFNKMLRERLETYCNKNKIINVSQLGGRTGARTADHLLVIKFLINKYVKVGKKNLYACFYDLRKAYDTVNRSKLFYNLLTEYNIGGNFLKLLRNLYHSNKIFVQTSFGLTEPFTTTTGVLQGDILSPMLFNLFLNKTPEVINLGCDPVIVENDNSSAHEHPCCDTCCDPVEIGNNRNSTLM